MKKNAVPELNAKWWAKNKAKTMKKSHLGKALKDFEVAEDLMDYDRMLKTLSEVKKKLVVALKACDSKRHTETIAGLKKYAGVIHKREMQIKANKKRAEARPAVVEVPKQKIGRGVVIWQKDIGREVLKVHHPKWIKDLKGYQLSLRINEDLLKILKKEGDLITPQQMVDDANDETKRIVTKLVVELIMLEKAAGATRNPAKQKKILGQFDKKAKAVLLKEQKTFQKIPAQRWLAFTKRRTQYKFYLVKSGFNVTLGTLGVAGGTLGIVGAAIGTAAPGGAALGIPSLVVGVTSTLRGVASLTSQLLDLAKKTEQVEKALFKDLSTLQKRYKNAQGQAKKTKQAVTETGASVLKGILSTDVPFLATIPKCDKNFGLWQNKVAGLAIRARNLSKGINKCMTECNKLEKALKKVSGKQARKSLDKLRNARKKLDSALKSCIEVMTRVTKADKNAPKLKKLLDGLKKQNNVVVGSLDKILPLIANMTLAISGFGLGLTGGITMSVNSVTEQAQQVLEFVNSGLGLVNDVGGEVKDFLEGKAEESLA